MKNNRRYWLVTTGLVGLIAILIGGTVFWQTRRMQANQQHQQQAAIASQLLTTKQIKHNIDSRLSNQFIKQQAPLTKRYQQDLKQAGNLQQAQVVLNPYKTAPLTALILFKTSQAATVSYQVAGSPSFGNELKEPTRDHAVPIVGLHANRTNHVTVTVKPVHGTTTKRTFAVKTAALPKAIQKLTITAAVSKPNQMALKQNSLTFLDRTTKQPLAVDAQGQVRWYSTNYDQHIFVQLSNGHLLLMNKQNADAEVYNDLVETDYLGRIYRQYHFSGLTSNADSATPDHQETETTVIHHDVCELPNHDLLATVSDGSRYIEDTLVQISHRTGKVTRVIDFKRLMPTNMWRRYTSTTRPDGKIDWFHQNSVVYDRRDHSLVISSRNQDLVMKLDYRTLKPVWLFSGRAKKAWPSSWQSKVLKPVGNTTVTGGQHAATILAGQQPGTERLLLYDNNNSITNGNQKTSGKFSAGMEYQVNQQKKTIRQVWSYGRQLGKANYTMIIGNTQALGTDQRLITFGYLNAAHGNASQIVETKGQKVVYRLNIRGFSGKGYVYRAYRVAVFPANYQFDLTTGSGA